MKSHLRSRIEHVAAVACCAGLLACGGSDSSSGDDPGATGLPNGDRTTAAQTDGGTSAVPTEPVPRSDGGANSDGGSSGDDGPKTPTLPVVGTVTGFTSVATRAYRDLA